MVCPYCSNDSQVINSRHQKRPNNVWRRRKCIKCSAVWTSVERPEYSTIWRVSHNGHLLDFMPETLLISLYEALRHKKSANLDAKHICDTVIQKLASKHNAILTTDQIKKTSYDILRRYDKVAAALYQATHTN